MLIIFLTDLGTPVILSKGEMFERSIIQSIDSMFRNLDTVVFDGFEKSSHLTCHPVRYAIDSS